MAKRPSCAVYGGGGHARVLIDALLASGAGRPAAVLEANRDLHGSKLFGVPVIGGDSSPLPKTITHFVIGLGSTSESTPRRRLYKLALSRGLKPLTVVHPDATVSRFAHLGPGCAVMAGAVINAGAALGTNVIVNTGAIIEHDCIIDDHAHIATGACLAGSVSVGAGAHVGVGACVRQSAKIGSCAVIGAGAAVVADIPAGTMAVGVPAKPVKK